MQRSLGSGRVIGALLVAMLMCSGCTRSPESKSTRYIEVGKKLLQQKDIPRALLQFRNAVQATPKSAEAYYQLGLAYLEGGDIRNGYSSLRRALELNPKHKGAQLRAAQLMATANDPGTLKDAQQRLEAFLQDNTDDISALHTLAMTELKLGDLTDATEHLERAMVAAPRELWIAVTAAQTKVRQNDVKGAEEILKRVSDSDPQSADAAVMLGRFYAAQNRSGAAEEQFKRAIRIAPTDETALFNLALLESLTGRKQEAEQNFVKLTKMAGPRFKSTYARFLHDEGRREEAIREFERLAKSAPKDRMIRTQLVAAYRELGREGDAEKLLAEALKNNQKDTDALLQRGEILLAAGKYELAETDLNRVLRLQPDSGEVHYVLAKLHQARGAESIFRQEMARALQLNPYMLRVRLEVVQALLMKKDAKSALELMDQTPAGQRESLEVLALRNWALWSSGDMGEMRKGIDQGLVRQRSREFLIQDGMWKLRAGSPVAARSSIEEVLKINPTDVTALSALGQTYVAQKNLPVAVQKVKEYATQQPKSAPVQYFLGEVLLGQGDHKGARAAFAAAKDASQQFAAADLSLARLDFQEQKFDDARKRLETVVAANGGSVAPRLWLAVLQELKGDYKAAIANFRKVLDVDPNQAQALNNLAYLLGETGGSLDEALRYAQRAVELAPERPEYCDTLGWIFYRRGVYMSAIQYLEKGSTDRKTVVGQYHLAMAYAKAGDQKRGQATLELAMKQNANVPEAKVAREVVGSSH